MVSIQLSFVPYQDDHWEFIIKTPDGDVTLSGTGDIAVSEEDQQILAKYAPCCVYTTYQTDEVNWP